jgi:hypothetical protein
MPKQNLFVEIGYRCGCVTVKSDPNISKKGGKYWLCKCDCGTELMVCGAQLNPRNKRSVKSCGCKRYDNLKTGTENISGTYMSNLIANARRRKKEFNLSIEYLQQLWEKQGGKCAISGLPIITINKKKIQRTICFFR